MDVGAARQERFRNARTGRRRGELRGPNLPAGLGIVIPDGGRPGRSERPESGIQERRPALECRPAASLAVQAPADWIPERSRRSRTKAVPSGMTVFDGAGHLSTCWSRSTGSCETLSWEVAGAGLMRLRARAPHRGNRAEQDRSRDPRVSWVSVPPGMRFRTGAAPSHKGRPVRNDGLPMAHSGIDIISWREGRAEM